jgi:RNA 2',3'-cyclic 3'-phosphodiesterase
MERIIIGIPLSPETQREVERICFGVPNIEWLEPASMHITMKYIRNISANDYLDLKELLLSIQFPPFSYTLEGLTVRHSKHKNGSFQIPVLNNPQLETLTKKIEKLLKPLQLEQSKQLTNFHVTIGYFHHLRPEHLQNFIEANTYFQSKPYQANEICIFSHHRTPKITYYSIEESYPLRKSPPQDLEEKGYEIPRSYLRKKKPL